MSMHNEEQFATPGSLPSDAKLGTDDPEEEAAQLEGQLDTTDPDPDPDAGTAAD